jgi:hypothetical protein
LLALSQRDLSSWIADSKALLPTSPLAPPRQSFVVIIPKINLLDFDTGQLVWRLFFDEIYSRPGNLLCSKQDNEEKPQTPVQVSSSINGCCHNIQYSVSFHNGF